MDVIYDLLSRKQKTQEEQLWSYASMMDSEQSVSKNKSKVVVKEAKDLTS
jgi:hypothetical protein